MTPVIHASQAPAQVEADRAECLRRRIVASKFLYETPRQAELWLALHQQYAPPADLAAPYQQAAQALAADWPHPNGSLIALGCGAGEKDRVILASLPNGIRFIPTDVSAPLVETAGQVGAPAALVFDLAKADDLPEFLAGYAPENRIFTFFGILPNFAPDKILPRLHALLQPGDRLLFSANLAPKGIEAILPQYDNAATREWLAEFPRSIGTGEGKVKIGIENDEPLQRIAAHFHFAADCELAANGEAFSFVSGDTLQLFVSYRYTLESLAQTLLPHGIAIEQSFTTANGEEGVFLCAPQ